MSDKNNFKNAQGCDLDGGSLSERTGAPVLTRGMLASGAIQAMVARDAPSITLMTEAERQASLEKILSVRPEGDVWVFAYGSLIWNPVIHHVEQRVARINGWHRSFCLSVQAGRGSPQLPGMVLGLEASGDCGGLAFRLDEKKLIEELKLLWRREMLSGAYIPRWVKVFGEDGQAFGTAITFTVNLSSPLYAGEISEKDRVYRLANAAGALGSSAEYLQRTCDALRSNGILDSEMERLLSLVRWHVGRNIKPR